MIDAVFLAADDAGFDFQNDLVSRTEFQQRAREFEILFQRHRGRVEHVRLEQVRQPGFAAACHGDDRR